MPKLDGGMALEMSWRRFRYSPSPVVYVSPVETIIIEAGGSLCMKLSIQCESRSTHVNHVHVNHLHPTFRGTGDYVTSAAGM